MGFGAVNHWKYAVKTMLNLEFLLTLAVFMSGGALAGTMVWLEKRPKQVLAPRLFPTTLFLLIGGVIAVFAGIHLLNLIGLQISRP